MSAYKDPSFQERTALARQARQKALDQLKAKPPADEAVLAERNAARIAREQAKPDERPATRDARELAKADDNDPAIKPAQPSLPHPGPRAADQLADRQPPYPDRAARKSSCTPLSHPASFSFT